MNTTFKTSCKVTLDFYKNTFKCYGINIEPFPNYLPNTVKFQFLTDANIRSPWIMMDFSDMAMLEKHYQFVRKEDSPSTISVPQLHRGHIFWAVNYESGYEIYMVSMTGQLLFALFFEFFDAGDKFFKDYHNYIDSLDSQKNTSSK